MGNKNTQTRHGGRRPNGHRRGLSMLLVGAVIVIAVGIGVVLMMNSGEDAGASSGLQDDRFVVRRGDFDISIPTSGELAARNQTEIINRVEARATISFIIDEGTFVKKGEVLFTLNDEDIRNRIRDGETSVTNAENQLEAGRSDLKIEQNDRDSRMAEADLRILLARLAYDSWEQGSVVTRRKALALEKETAQKNYDRLVERFEASKRLLEKDFLSIDEYKRDEISMIEARARIEQTDLDIDVYERFTYEQEKKQKESDLEQAEQERERILERTNARVKTAESALESRERNLETVREKQEELKKQLEYCTVTAPTDGLVVYRSSLERDRRGGSDPPEIGTTLSRNETVIILPDTSQMVAEVKVNEALSGSIVEGQKASVTSDARPDQAFMGTVLGVGVLAEGGSWRDPNRRDYTVRILIDGENNQGLKPSMRCKADINLGRVENALHVPIMAIHRNGPMAYVYIPDGEGFEQRAVVMGQSSELFAEIKSGLEEGETVMLTQPSAEKVTTELEAPDMGQGFGGPPSVGGGGPPKGIGGSGKPAAGSGRPPSAAAKSGT